MILQYVLSLFDGMSCGQIALKEINIGFERYYASEIDKHAISQTQLNFPRTIQLGDVTQWREWGIEWEKVDLILAGSPCQGFSFAGKQLAFDDPRSRLFFEFVEILKHTRKYNPNVKYLLENVNMKHEHMRVINETLGVFPININSCLVSAQNRNRWYWTNIKTNMLGLFCEVYVAIPQPKDEGILLADILETEVDEKYYISDAVISRMMRKKYSNPAINPDKAGTLNTKNNSAQMSLDSGTTFIAEPICVAMRGREACLTNKRTEYGKKIRKDYEAGKIEASRGNIQRLEPREDGKTNCLTSVQKDNLILTQNYVQWDSSGKGHKSQNNRAFYENGKHGTLTTSGCENTGVVIGHRIRRLTPLECDRLQTIPDWYKWRCSETQHYKMLGNGWTVKVIMHILNFLNC